MGKAGNTIEKVGLILASKTVHRFTGSSFTETELVTRSLAGYSVSCVVG
jgi:hypothetical protein